MSERFDGRAIERSQPGPISGTPDPSEGLRSFVETAPRRPRETGVSGPPHAIRAPRYLIDVRHPSGRVIQTYNADTDELVAKARQHAKDIDGCTTAHEVLDDFR